MAFRKVFFVSLVVTLSGCQTMGSTSSATYEYEKRAIARVTPMREDAKACVEKVNNSALGLKVQAHLVTGDSDPLLFEKLSNQQVVDKEFTDLMVEQRRELGPCWTKIVEAESAYRSESAEIFKRYISESNEDILSLIRGEFRTRGKYAEARYKKSQRLNVDLQALFSRINNAIAQEQSIAQQQAAASAAASAAAFAQGMQNGFNQMQNTQMMMNQNYQAQQQRQQQQQNNQNLNCSTKYNPYAKSWDMVCR